MTILATLSGIARGFRNRRAVRSLEDLDDHQLADIGLLRTDVRASLHLSLLDDPSRALKAVCCHWRTYLKAERSGTVANACCA
jgi:uncharacterized protein YjiS (DUF1127 family)